MPARIVASPGAVDSPIRKAAVGGGVARKRRVGVKRRRSTGRRIGSSPQLHLIEEVLRSGHERMRYDMIQDSIFFTCAINQLLDRTNILMPRIVQSPRIPAGCVVTEKKDST
ncbi:hypothetical protein B296_00055241 [Ensete ventricosum]|uniref:Uncharacterized protein n=1 Tax=Ensete ventricosum TaxID=4639 RepID=A0A426X4U5_ENSVE|nr:hypothetical protein B296_00055241 [Ensete ventricosum]